MGPIDALRAQFQGQIFVPSSDGYDEARKLWNGNIDRRPAVIARCTGAPDVVAALRYARANGLIIAVRSGGHNLPGLSTCDGGLVIDLSQMKSIRVDPDARTAVAQPGVTWGELDAATQAFGLATPGGEVSSTGIAGLTLGGGIGWLTRMYGLACDSLLGVEMVTADGRVVRADATENPDLYWGVRGGGGNFGVVTSFTYRLRPVGLLLAGNLLYPADRAREVLRFARDWSATLPNEASLEIGLVTAPPVPFIPEPLQGKRAVVIVLCWIGDHAEGERVLAPMRAFGPPVLDLIGPMPYVVLQQLLDPMAPRGLQYYEKSHLLRSFDDDTIDVMLKHWETITSPLSMIGIRQLGGAVADVGAHETAFAHRDVKWLSGVQTCWPSAAEDATPHIEWSRSVWKAMQPAAFGNYVNHLGNDEADLVHSAYGVAYERLAKLKSKYDPENVFRLNVNVEPKA